MINYLELINIHLKNPPSEYTLFSNLPEIFTKTKNILSHDLNSEQI